jgi:hypothetical protein
MGFPFLDAAGAVSSLIGGIFKGIQGHKQQKGMTDEHDKVYNDQLRNYNNDLNAKNALQNAAWNNKGGAVDSFSNALVGAGNMAQNGAFGGGGGGNPTAMVQGNSIPQVPNYAQGQLNGGMYINPFMTNPQQNYVNPFIR